MRPFALTWSNSALRGIPEPGRGEDQGRKMAEGCGASSLARKTMYATTAQELGEQIQECIAKCLDCRSICMKVVDHCSLVQNGEPARLNIRLLLNCSEICATVARFMLRGSEFGERLCAICAEVCKSCAGQFDRVGRDAETEACAAACRECAECCERIAGVVTS